MKLWRTLAISLVVALALLLAVAGNALALVEQLTLDELTAKADSILVGEVTDIACYEEGRGNIYTLITLSVERTIKGEAEGEVVLKVPGGEVGGLRLQVSDTPHFQLGERAVVFLEEDVNNFTLCGWYQGKFGIQDNKIIGTGQALPNFVADICQAMEAQGTTPEISMKPASIKLESPLQSKGTEAIQGATEFQTGWQNIMTDDFEGAFPGVWTVFANSGPDAYWGKDGYRSHGGSYSAFCAKDGTAGVNPPSHYPNNMEAWMIYGPFGLEGATDAVLNYYLWLESESTYDGIIIMASTNGVNFYGGGWSGSSGDWAPMPFDLTAVPTLGNLCGEDEVWIAFVFESDSSNTDKGAFIDDVVLRQYVAGINPPHIDSISPTSGSAGTGFQVTINGSDFGAAPGSSKVTFFYCSGQPDIEGPIVSWSNSQIVCQVPTRASSGPVTITTAGGESNGYDFYVTFGYCGCKWPGANPIGEDYLVNENCQDCTGELAAIQAAFQTWNNVPTADFNFSYGGTTTATDYSRNGHNEIMWVNYDTGSIATNWCWSYWFYPDEIVETDIVFNDLDYTWSASGVPPPGQMDVQNVGTHELGHSLCLADLYGAADSEKTMYGFAGAGETKKRTLHNDDKAGIQWIYPGEAVGPPTITTNAATNMEESTATLHGAISNDGGEACQYRFEYDTNSGEPYAYNTGWAGSKTSGQSFSAAISGLSEGTKYYFRAQAKNSGGTASGSELTFLTKPDAPISFGATTAGTTQINLSWTKGDGAQKTKIQRKEGSYPANRNDGTQVYFGTGTGTPDTGLTPGTTYYYRAWSYVQGSEQWSDSYAQDWATTAGAEPDMPDITVSPTSFDVTLAADTTHDYTLTIGNTGDATLTYDISDVETTGMTATAGSEKLLSQPASMVLEAPLEGSPVKPEDTPEGGNGWENIMTDSFEGTFPGTRWELYGDPTWGKESYRHHTGSYSAWCAGSSYNPPYNYPNNMEAWMIYGPFSLTDVTDAELNFWFWNRSQGPDDYLFWGASTDGSLFYGAGDDGDSAGWQSVSFDLTDVYELGNLCGQTQIWIGFWFGSDGSVTDKGAFIDDVVLRKYVGGAAEDCLWLDEEPKSGTVLPGGETDITVTIDTTGLGSTYTANIIISSNDPNEAEVIVPVTLTVVPGVSASVSIEPPSRTVSPGSSCNIDVWVDAGDNNLRGIDVWVEYDSDAMTTTVADVEAHDLIGALLEIGPEVTEAAGVGEVSYILVSVDAVAGVDASLMTITFTMDAAAEPGDYALTITKGDLADENAEPVVVLINDGTVTVVIGRKGDFDNDGDIDIFDFVLFAAAYDSELGEDNYNPVGDFDGDGDIDIYDFVNFAAVYGA